MSQLIDNLNTIESVKTDIKSAIEAKGVDMTGVSFPGYANKIGEIPVGGTMGQLSVLSNGTYTPPTGIDGWDRVTVDVPQSVTGFTEKQITEGVRIVDLNNSASSVHPYVFEKDTYLQTVNLPNCSNVNENAFASCTNLTTVSLPICEKIWEYVFAGCTKLQSIYAPSVTLIWESTFAQCTSLQSIYMPNLSLVGGGAFENCENLESVYIPACTLISAYAFNNCYNLQTISLSICSELQDEAFANCSKLSELNLPTVSIIGRRALQSTGLNVLTLGYSSVVSLTSGRFDSPIPSTCSVYVPASLVEEYKSAQNWSVYSSQIFPIE